MKPGEKRLLIVFFAVLAIMGGLIAAAHLSSWQRKLEARTHQIGLEELEIEETLAEAEDWQERVEWLRKNQPTASNDLDADNLLYEHVLKLAGEEKLAVMDKQFEAPVKTPFYRQSGVTLTVKGPLPAVLHWIYLVQGPTEGCTVPECRLSPDQADPSLVQCRVVFRRWYQLTLTQS